MKKNKTLKKIFKLIISIFIITTFLSFIGLGTFFYISINQIKDVSLSPLIEPKYTQIVDENNNEIETLGKNNQSYIKYNDIPKILIEALLSIEDNEFFYHNGINTKRIITSLFNNLNKSNWIQGGSTITQQLVKNTLLSNERTYKRKIQEAYLSLLLEQNMTKEEILENYFNRIYFDQAIPGIKYACQKFFNKDVSLINYIEASILVGLVKSPSQYYPFSYPEKANLRKNLVLKAMLDNKVISNEEYQLGINKDISSLLVSSKSDKENYRFQSYLDVVYKEAKNILGFDVYLHPVKIKTYIDTSLQSHIDEIQNGNVIPFSNNLQQIGGAIIDNNNSKIVGIIGGRSYFGKKIYNRAFDMKRNPASTMKPIFTYALACEYLHYNELTTLIDEPYTYRGSNVTVNNADHQYMGNLSLIEALGYSRNTCTLSTLEKVIDKIGEEKVVSYLNEIGIMDEGQFTLSYGIGGMTYGASPIQMAGAYCLLSNHGKYLKPSTIEEITSLETNEILYSRSKEYKQIISEESSDIITSALQRVIDGNYYNIGLAKPGNVTIAGKTGTGAYDYSTIKKYNYPSNADKDIWFSGYSPYYTASIWTGFDEPIINQKSYFSGNDAKKRISKEIFKEIFNYISPKDNGFYISKNLEKVYVVKGLDKAYLPNEFTPKNFISFAYYKKEDIPQEILPYPSFISINNLSSYLYDNKIHISIFDQLTKDDIYTNFYGERGFLIKIKKPSQEEDLFFINSSEFEYQFTIEGIYNFEICESFKDNFNSHGNIYIYSYYFSL